MYKTSILYYNILFSICCKGKRWDNARLLIKVGEFLAEVIARYLREERDISSFSFGRLPKKKGGGNWFEETDDLQYLWQYHYQINALVLPTIVTHLSSMIAPAIFFIIKRTQPHDSWHAWFSLCVFSPAHAYIPQRCSDKWLSNCFFLT